MVISERKINERLTTDPSGFVAESEKEYFDKVKSLADEIYEKREERPIVLISGPSGSGKTTTALNLESELDSRGCETHTLSLDNYFLSLDENEKKLSAEGKLDLESPDRMNRELLNEQLEKMLRCEPVRIPKFDFAAAKSIDSGRVLQRKPGELIILEGIHALNPDVVTVARDRTSKVYVSVRTRIEDEGTVLHPSKIRLLRRMIRDKLFRGNDIPATLAKFDGVEAGERNFIMPYKHLADLDIDTFIAYETAVYAKILGPDLSELAKSREEVRDLSRIVSDMTKLDESCVPRDSLVREFIGNGKFEY